MVIKENFNPAVSVHLVHTVKCLLVVGFFVFFFPSFLILFFCPPPPPVVFYPPAPSGGSGVQRSAQLWQSSSIVKQSKSPPLPLKTKQTKGKLTSQYKFLPSPTSGEWGRRGAQGWEEAKCCKFPASKLNVTSGPGALQGFGCHRADPQPHSLTLCCSHPTADLSTPRHRLRILPALLNIRQRGTIHS